MGRLGLGLGLGAGGGPWWAPLLADSPLVVLPGELMTPSKATDVSGNSNNATQGTGANQPAQATGGLKFNGTSHFMDLATVASASTAYTVFAVVEDEIATNPTSSSVLFKFGTYSACAMSCGVTPTGTVGYVPEAGSGFKGVLKKVTSATQTQLLTWKFNSLTALDMFRDGEQLSSDTITTVAPMSLGTVVLGKLLSYYFKGTLRFFAIVPTALATGRLAAWHSVLGARFGIAFSPLSLPLSYWYTGKADYVTVAAGEVTALLDRSGKGRNAPVTGAGANVVLVSDDGPVRYPGSGTKRHQTAIWTRVQPHCDFHDGIISRAGAAVQHAVLEGTAAGAGLLYGSTTGEPTAFAGGGLALAGGTVTTRKRTCVVFDGASSRIDQNDGTPATGDPGSGGPNGMTFGARFNGTWPSDSDMYHAIGLDYAPTDQERTALHTWLAAHP